MGDKKLAEQANDDMIASVKAERPSQFRVGGSWDGKTATGGLTYERKLSNLWGITAYAKAYWNDAPVIPTDKFGYVIGGELVKKYGEPK